MDRHTHARTHTQASTHARTPAHSDLRSPVRRRRVRIQMPRRLLVPRCRRIRPVRNTHRRAPSRARRRGARQSADVLDEIRLTARHSRWRHLATAKANLDPAARGWAASVPRAAHEYPEYPPVRDPGEEPSTSGQAAASRGRERECLSSEKACRGVVLGLRRSRRAGAAGSSGPILGQM